MQPAMLLRRSLRPLSRRVPVRLLIATSPSSRPFTSSIARRADEKSRGDPKPEESELKMQSLSEIHSEEDLLPPGAKPGTVPTDLDQSTGLERLEILGKMQGVDVFDMKPLDASRKGTLRDPIIVRSAGDEQLAGCTGYPVDSHWVLWCLMSRDRPMTRCADCGSVYKMEYIGPPDDPHDHHEHYEEPKNLSDYIRPEYAPTPQPGYETYDGGKKW